MDSGNTHTVPAAAECERGDARALLPRLRTAGRGLLVLGLWMSVQSLAVGAAGTESSSEQATVDRAATTGEATWLDRGHHYVTNSTSAFANWIDHFFGTERAETESAWSSIRLITESTWHEDLPRDADTRVRGKVDLPRLNRRLSLLFTDEDDDQDLRGEAVPDPLAADDTSASGELQYTVRNRKRYRVDYRVGLRASGRFKSSLRYRYELPWREDLVGRLTETVYFVDGDGFSSRLNLDLDHALNDHRLLRWSNRVEVAEEYDGEKWSSQLSWVNQLSDHAAWTHYTWVAGETQPESLTTVYGIGSRYRRSFYRRWLFLEAGPAYQWVRGDIASEREGAWLFSVRLEALLEKPSHR